MTSFHVEQSETVRNTKNYIFKKLTYFRDVIINLLIYLQSPFIAPVQSQDPLAGLLSAIAALGSTTDPTILALIAQLTSLINALLAALGKF